jgi:predicted nuclease with TOPRIM domain
MLKNKIMQPLLFLVISIILYLTMNKNNLFKNHISNINNKYDNILNIILNNRSKVSNNIQDNTVHSNIFDNDENKTLKNIQNNDINNDIYNMTTENFSVKDMYKKAADSIVDMKKKAESAVTNQVKQTITGIEGELSTGLAEVGSEVVKDVIPNQYISEMLELTEQEKQLLTKYRNSPIRDKKYRIAIDVNSKCDDSSLNYLTKRNGASLYYNLMESCRGNDNEMLINTPVCKDKCLDIDTVYGSINEDINELKKLKTKLEDMLEGKKVALARILNLINSQTEGEKEKYLSEITSLKSEISNLENTIKQIYSEESQLKNTNSTLQTKINTQNEQINTLQSNNSNLQTNLSQLSKDWSNLYKDFEQAQPGYQTYDKVLSFGNYNTSNSLYVQGVTSEGGCVNNLPINTAQSICNKYGNYCDGFYTYGYAPGQSSSLRTCFKKNIDRTQPVVKYENKLYPSNMTYLKIPPNAPPEKCTGYTKSGYYTGMPCNYVYNQVSQKSGKTAADTWCSGSGNEGCTLQTN